VGHGTLAQLARGLEGRLGRGEHLPSGADEDAEEIYRELVEEHEASAGPAEDRPRPPVTSGRIADEVDRLALTSDGQVIDVDVRAQTVTARALPGWTGTFAIGAYSKRLISEGLDPIRLTLKEAGVIDGFLERDRRDRPWVYLSEVPADAALSAGAAASTIPASIRS
jgi:hypothetical protein